MPGIGQEALTITLASGATAAQLAGASAVFSPEGGTADVATMAISAAPSSTVHLHAFVSPNTRGVPGVDLSVDMTACRPGQGPSDNGLGCALCRPGTASPSGAACTSCTAGHFQSTSGAVPLRFRPTLCSRHAVCGQAWLSYCVVCGGTNRRYSMHAM